MDKNIIDKLPDILQSSIDTLKNTSYDSNNKEYMTECKDTVINFDKVVKNYYKYKNYEGIDIIPKSNDALYISNDNEFYFIEFKNGKLNSNYDGDINGSIKGTISGTVKGNINGHFYGNFKGNFINNSILNDLKIKIYDSIFILSNIKYDTGNNYIDNISDFSKTNIKYILVYNEEKNPKLALSIHLNSRVNKNTKRHNISKIYDLKGFIFNDINIYNRKDFESKFLRNKLKLQQN